MANWFTAVSHPQTVRDAETVCFRCGFLPLRIRVERFFNRIKQFYGLITRYDRRQENYLAALKPAVLARYWNLGHDTEVYSGFVF